MAKSRTVKKIREYRRYEDVDWLKKKKRDDSAKRREDERQKEMAKSDPELDRIISDIESVTIRIETFLKVTVRNNTLNETRN